MSDPLAPTGVDHAEINVSDVPGGITFYTETSGTGAEPRARTSGSPAPGWTPASGQQVHLIEATVPNNLGQHFALTFDDLGAAITELRRRQAQGERPMAVGTTGRQQAFTIDPSGNAIELHQHA